MKSWDCEFLLGDKEGGGCFWVVMIISCKLGDFWLIMQASVFSSAVIFWFSVQVLLFGTSHLSKF